MDCYWYYISRNWYTSCHLRELQYKSSTDGAIMPLYSHKFECGIWLLNIRGSIRRRTCRRPLTLYRAAQDGMGLGKVAGRMVVVQRRKNDYLKWILFSALHKLFCASLRYVRRIQQKLFPIPPIQFPQNTRLNFMWIMFGYAAETVLQTFAHRREHRLSSECHCCGFREYQHVCRSHNAFRIIHPTEI